ncbi:hypothetical protein Golomagni_07261, partial [Golovinomyces magnicellulatus]
MLECTRRLIEAAGTHAPTGNGRNLAERAQERGDAHHQRAQPPRATRDQVRAHLEWIQLPRQDRRRVQGHPQQGDSSLTFTGPSGTLKRKYHVELEFFAQIDPAESKINHTSKNIEIKLQKKDLKEEYWPRLTKDKVRLHNVKTDFDKWVDEDEQDEEAADAGAGMPDMGGAGGMDPSLMGMGGAGGQGFDLQSMMAQMGQMGGMSGGMPDFSGEDDDDDEADDVVDSPAVQEA